MLELHGDFGIKMRSLSFSLLAAIVVFSSCRKQVEEPKDRTVYVISRTSGQALSNVEMHLNGQFHSYTPLDGITQETDLLRTDSLYPVDPEFQYTLIAEVENATTLSTTYWATKVATQEDSLAVAYLKDLQNTVDYFLTVPMVLS